MAKSRVDEPALAIPADGTLVPQLAFGLYKVPPNEVGESIILDAVKAGYRHFDTASFYGNERTLGNALRRSGVPRGDFFIVSKVWNDAQRDGTVRTSVLESVDALGFGGYFDLFLIHWPVPGRFARTYRDLEVLREEGKVRHLGLSNFSPAEYEELLSSGTSVPPAVNQFEVSPFMYRPEDVLYFQRRGILVSSSKSLHRGGECLDNGCLKEISSKHSVTPAQVMLRWGVQKGLVVVCKTVTLGRMAENRALFQFELNEEEMWTLDGLTTREAILERGKLEEQRKLKM